MQIKKGVFNYIFWAIFSVVIFTSLGVSAINYGQSTGAVDYLMIIIIEYAIAIGLTLVLIGAFKLFDAKLKKDNSQSSVPLSTLLETAIVLVTTIIGVFVRFIAVFAYVAENEVSSVYLDYCKGASGTGLNALSNASFLYANLLKFIYKFLPQDYVVLYAGALISLICAVIMYFAIRKSAGKWASIFMYLLFMFLPGSFMGYTHYDGGLIYAFFAGIFYLALSLICEANSKGKIESIFEGAYFILLGLCSAALMYLDISGVIFFIVAIVALIARRNRDPWKVISKIWMQLIIYIASHIIFFYLGITMLSVAPFGSGIDALIKYGLAFRIGSFNLSLLTVFGGTIDSAVVLGLCLLYVCLFLKNRRDKAFVFVFPIIALTIFKLLGMENTGYNSVADLLYIIVGAIGLTSLDALGKNYLTEEEVKAIEEKEYNKEQKKKEKRYKERKPSKNSIVLEDENSAKKNKVTFAKKPVEEPKKNEAIEAVSGNSEVEETDGSYAADVQALKELHEQKTKVKRVKDMDDADIAANMARYLMGEPDDEEIIEEAVANEPDSKPVVGVNYDSAVKEIISEDKNEAAEAKESDVTSSDDVTKNADNAENKIEIIENKADDNNENSVDAVKVNESADSIKPVTTPVSTVAKSQRIGSRRGKMFTPVRTAYENSLLAQGKELPPKDVEKIKEIVAAVPSMPEIPENTTDDAALIEENVQILTEGLNVEKPSEEVNKADVKAPSMPINADTDKVKDDVAENEKDNNTHKFSKMSVENAASKLELTQPIPQIDIIEPAPIINNTVTKEADLVDNARLADSVHLAPPVNKPNEHVGPVYIGENDWVKDDKVKEPGREKVEINDVVPLSQTVKEKPKMIKNPLPGPKPHVAKELSYDYIPKAGEMDFDIKDISDKDDYDIK